VTEARIVPWTANRQVIYDLLTRAKTWHAPVSTCWDYDAAALCAARRALRVDGRVVGLPACVVKATALVLERFPQLNRHLFHGLLGKYVVEFGTIRCTLIVMRRGAGKERLLFPVNLERANELSVEEIQRTIDHHRFAPLEELPQLRTLERLKRLPRLALRWFSWKVRSDHRFYARHFGTYGVSCMARGEFGPLGGSTLANTGAAFLIGPLRQVPQVRAGRVVPRPMLGVMLVADHYLLDGMDMLEAMAYLRRLIATPTRLGLPDVPVPADGAADAGSDEGPDGGED
jgi:pyruvate/2-oxoglutarate dehydrogenase complex dihydrolipoamide acyltransferase (E2) component